MGDLTLVYFWGCYAEVSECKGLESLVFGVEGLGFRVQGGFAGVSLWVTAWEFRSALPEGHALSCGV